MELYFSSDDFSRELCDLIRIPSISAKKEHKEDAYRILETVTKIVEPMGFETRIVGTQGNPGFIATLDNEANEWLTIYNHLDVQPANEPQWKTNPFEPVEKEGAIIGRGATDDKGPALTIIHAIREMQRQNRSLPNIQLVYETEEEIGSPHFGPFLEEGLAEKWIRKPHSILVSDSEFEGEFPSITYKLKGNMRCLVSLETASMESHSGTTGGIAVNPLEVLCRALTQVKDGYGRFQLEGFYDNVTPPSPREKEALKLAAERMDVEQFKNDLGLMDLQTSDPKAMLNQSWNTPQMELHGFEGTQYLPGEIKTSIPNKVVAKVSFRLVPGQDPARIKKGFERYLQRYHPRITVKASGLPATMVSLDSPYMELARQASVTGFGSEPLFTASGGSIGAMALFQQAWKEVPMVLLSQSLLSDGYHAPNEHFTLDQAEKGMKTMGEYIRLIAEKK